MKTLSNSRAGDFAEYYVVTWLWDQGYDVFTNSSCVGPVDMIAYKDGETILIDVKSRHGTKHARGRARSKEQAKLGVQIVFFDSLERKAHWVRHRK